jgi:hypothetical protein
MQALKSGSRISSTAGTKLKLPSQVLVINIPPTVVLPPREELARMIQQDLKTLCKERNLSGNGNKTSSVGRLFSCDPTKAPPFKIWKRDKQVQQSFAFVDIDDSGVPNLDNCAPRDDNTSLDLQPATKKLKRPPAARKLSPTQGNK